MRAENHGALLSQQQLSGHTNKADVSARVGSTRSMLIRSDARRELRCVALVSKPTNVDDSWNVRIMQI